MSDQKTVHQPSFISGFVFGTFISAVGMYLLTTDNGRKTVAAVIKEIEKTLDDPDTLKEDTGKKLQEKIQEIEEKSETLLKEAKEIKEEIVAEVSEKTEEKLDDTLEKIEEIHSQGLELTQGLRQRFFKKKKK